MEVISGFALKQAPLAVIFPPMSAEAADDTEGVRRRWTN